MEMGPKIKPAGFDSELQHQPDRVVSADRNPRERGLRSLNDHR
jgi:hypothetical protein